MLYTDALKKACEAAPIPWIATASTKELGEAIDRLSKILTGPLSNAERIGNYADRKHMREEYARRMEAEARAAIAKAKP